MATPDWKGLFEWSMKYQDGTSREDPVRTMAKEDRDWFEEAVKHYTVNVSHEMVRIKEELESRDDADSNEIVSRKEELLDELLEIVENIDNARDLTSIGGLETLTALLKDSNASLRWRAAEVAATCVQNNPPVQEWLLKAGCLPKLIRLLEDPDVTCRQKGLLAISCLVRNNAAGTNAFLAEDGVDWLIRLLREDQPKVQRKALQLLDHISRTVSQRLPSKKLLPLVIRAISEGTIEMREAALQLAIRLSRDASFLEGLRQDTSFVDSLDKSADRLAQLDVEEAAAHGEETVYNRKLLAILQANQNSTAAEEQGEDQSFRQKPGEESKPILLLH